VAKRRAAPKNGLQKERKYASAEERGFLGDLKRGQDP